MMPVFFWRTMDSARAILELDKEQEEANERREKEAEQR